MNRYAIINAGTVENIAIADAPLSDNWIVLAGLDPQPGIGWAYSEGVFTAPAVPEVVVPENPTEWLIDLGPFFDRFGAASMQIELSSDTMVQAILRDFSRRKWMDLKDSRVAGVIDLLMTKNVGVDAVLKSHVLTTPVDPMENLALRKLYF